MPRNIPRSVDGVPLRLTYIYKIFKTLSLSHGSHDEDLEIQEAGEYVRFLEAHCHNFLSTQYGGDEFWTLSEKECSPFNKFLTPPVRACLRCEKLLTMRNYPSKAKLFTTDGPLPCSKITLECRACCCTYGPCSFSDELGCHFYPAEMRVDVVEVSNVTYVDLELYRWFPPLRLALNLSRVRWYSFDIILQHFEVYSFNIRLILVH